MIPKIKTLEDYCQQYQKSIAKPEIFWSEIAQTFHWKKPWDRVLESNFKVANTQWFIGGKLNITENILDRYAFTHRDTVAIIWEPNDPNQPNRVLTYEDLFRETCRFANVLKQQGIGKGDRVVIYLPMVPEAVIAMLACARIGAIHSVVFAGFSSHSLVDRINDCKAKLVLTSDGNYRGSKVIPMKAVVDQALEKCPSVEKTIVLERTKQPVKWDPLRDLWWHQLLEEVEIHNQAETMDAEDILFILYTSGSTGKPKGVVHTCGGYMVYTAYTFQNIFQYNKGDVFWCTADVGWITGHSYIVYGPLLAGATTLLFEGVPTYPHPGRFWEIVDKYQVNQFYTAPTAIRALQSYGIEPVEPYSLQSLKVIGSVGEPINSEAWHWYHDHIGKKQCPIVDTWWQTETGGIMISPIASVTPTKPTYASLPLPGIQPVLVDSKGDELIGNNVEGNLCVRFPWPSILRTIYGDHNRCKETYFSPYPGLYFTGDGAKRDHDGYLRIIGRVDDVINVSGHRIGTAEVENAINTHPLVTESAVVGYSHAIKGEGIFAFVIGKLNEKNSEKWLSEIRSTVADIIGPFAKPDRVQMVPDLPKTRSGKIMRRILRKIASGETEKLGDTSTLLNPLVLKEILSTIQTPIKK